MHLAIGTLLVVLMGLASSFRASDAAWLNHAISDGLGTTLNGPPSAGSRGVAWVSEVPPAKALALWDRITAVFIVGPSRLMPSGSIVLHPDLTVLSRPSLGRDGIAFEAGASISETEIHLWNEHGTHRITYNRIRDAHPSIFGRNIAWDNHPAPSPSPLSADREHSEIWFWNGYGAWQVTDNEVEDAFPSLYELTIAWCSEGKVLYATIPDPEWGVPLTPTVVAEGGSPSLFKKQIAYYASDGNDTEIFLYDMESNEILQVTDNAYQDISPRLYDGTVVWYAFDGRDYEIFYWDGKATHQLTDNDIDDTNPSLWGTGMNTTIAYVETWWERMRRNRIICLRPAVTVSRQQGSGQVTLTWPSLQGRSYRVEYSDDLVNWKVAAEAVPSAGYGETFWTDGPASGTTPPPSEVSQRFYRVCETE